MSVTTSDTWGIEAERLDLLLDLLDTPAPSGFEGPAGDVWARAADEFATVTADPLGNRFATVNAGAGSPVLVAGHLDEIGFIVTRIDREHGLLRFEGIGGWNPAIVAGQRVTILTERGPVVGAVGWIAPHQSEDDAAPKMSDLWIDVGAVDADEVAGLVRVGDPVVLSSPPVLLPNRRVLSRSVDNRIGSFIALEAARHCVGAPIEVTAVGAISEETTQLGAEVSAYRLRPDAAIVIDVTFTSDVPGKHEEDVALGKGPVLSFGATTNGPINAQLLELATELDLPIQLSGAGTYTSTDADVVTRAGVGIPTSLLCIPTRHLHSPSELFDLRDAEVCIQLIAEWIRRRAV